MTNPDLDKIKILALLQIHDSGPLKLDGHVWPVFDQLYLEHPQHYTKFFDLALAELDSEGLIVISGDTVFLRRSLLATKFPIDIDLDTAVRLATLTNANGDSGPINPLRLSGADLRRFCSFTDKLAEQIQSFKHQQSKVLQLEERLRSAETQNKKLRQQNNELRAELNKMKGKDDATKAEQALATHRMANGSCELCGLSRDLIVASKIQCDHRSP